MIIYLILKRFLETVRGKAVLRLSYCVSIDCNPVMMYTIRSFKIYDILHVYSYSDTE